MVRDLRPAMKHRIFDSECIALIRRVALFEPLNHGADHGCTGSIGTVPVRMEKIQEARRRAPAESRTHGQSHHADRRSLFIRVAAAGFEAPQPAGDYRVDHDEESIEGILQTCLATRRRVHSPAGNRPAEFGATDGAAQPSRPRRRSAPSLMQRSLPAWGALACRYGGGFRCEPLQK
jgi:hypothetical protein